MQTNNSKFLPTMPSSFTHPLTDLDLRGLLLAALGSCTLLMSTVRSCLSSLFHNASRGESRFAFLDIFRFMAICWVVINHLGSEGRLDILRHEPSGQKFKQAVHDHPIFGALIGNSGLGVEIFLVLSGLLAAHSWQRHWRPERTFMRNATSFLVRRWLRLGPPTLAFIAISISPLSKWLLPQFHLSIASTCNSRKLLGHALFLNNWESEPTCYGWLWYLGLDWQCYFLAPFILALLARMPRMGISLTASLIVGSALLRGWHCRTNGICNKSDVDIPFVYLPDLQAASSANSQFSALFSLYARPATKLGPFLIGLLIGIKTIRKDQLALQQSSARGLFICGLGLAFAVIYGILPEYWHPEQGNTLYNTLYTATFRTLFAIAIGMIIVSRLCRNDSQQPISPIWAALAQLTFSAFLVHMPVIFLFNHLDLYQNTKSVYGLLLAFPFALLLSFGVALIFHCLVERPLSRLFTFKSI